MNTPQFILQALFFVVNTFALCFVVYFVCKICGQMNNKLDQYLHFIKHVSCRNDVIYFNQLELLKRRLAKEERYEEMQVVNKILEDELNRLKKNENITD